MDLDRYVPRRSRIHQADPRLKLILAMVAILSIALLPVGAFVAFGIIWATLVVASTVARLGPWRLVRGSWVVLPFALVAVPLLFTRPGEVVVSLNLGPLSLTVTDEGVRDVLTIVLKSWLSVQVALLLAYTTPFSLLVDALTSLRVPGILVSIISFMYRYLAVLIDEASRMNWARILRSASAQNRSGGSLTWRARVTGAMVGSLFIRSYERSERVYAAMLARGFDGTFRTTKLVPPDQRAIVSFGVVLAAIILFTIGVNVAALS